jgi:hypothetical protein
MFGMKVLGNLVDIGMCYVTDTAGMPTARYKSELTGFIFPHSGRSLSTAAHKSEVITVMMLKMLILMAIITTFIGDSVPLLLRV